MSKFMHSVTPFNIALLTAAAAFVATRSKFSDATLGGTPERAVTQSVNRTAAHTDVSEESNRDD